jgi:hypothetical protein
MNIDNLQSHRIHGAAISMVTSIPSIYPSHVSIYIIHLPSIYHPYTPFTIVYQHHGSVMGMANLGHPDAFLFRLPARQVSIGRARLQGLRMVERNPAAPWVETWWKPKSHGIKHLQKNWRSLTSTVFWGLTWFTRTQKSDSIKRQWTRWTWYIIFEIQATWVWSV